MRRVKKLLELKSFKKAYTKASKNYPLDTNKILLISDVRRELDGNLKCVKDHMEESGYEIKVICKDRQRDGLNSSDIEQIAFEMATSGFVFMEDVLSFMNEVQVRDGQKYIQLWHAAGAFKKFGFSRLQNEKGIHISSGYRKYTHASASAEDIRVNYAEAFGIDIEKVQAKGIPRTDMFFDDQAKAECLQKLYEQYPILMDRKLILFAPTYRGTRPAEAHYDFTKIEPEIVAGRIRKANESMADSEKKYLFAVKWHPAMVSSGAAKEYAEKLVGKEDVMIDLSELRDANQLLLAADVLITDYSSVTFDYALLDKPIVYYPWDLEEYYNGRSFYYPFEEYVYGAVTDQLDEMLDAVFAGKMMPEKRQAFRKKFVEACDGRSTEKIVKWIFDRQ